MKLRTFDNLVRTHGLMTSGSSDRGCPARMGTLSDDGKASIRCASKGLRVASEFGARLQGYLQNLLHQKIHTRLRSCGILGLEAEKKISNLYIGVVSMELQ